jgi:TaqI-like C-terminal specificity domain
MTSAAIGDLRIESELVRPLLRGRDVRAFSLSTDAKMLVFPYRETAGAFVLRSEEELQKFPVTWRYLNQHKKELAARVWFGKNATELSGAWYGMMYLQQLKYFQQPHILSPALSNTSNFAVGDGSLFATGTAGVTGLSLAEPIRVPVEYLLGLLNAGLLALYVVRHSPVYQGGYHKFSTQYLRGIPIVVPDGAGQFAIQAKIVELVKQISENMLRVSGTKSPMEQRFAERLINGARAEIDRLVHSLYRLDDAQTRWVNEQVRRLKLL